MKTNTWIYVAAIFFVVTGLVSLVYLTFNIVLQVLGTMGSWVAFGVLMYHLFTSVAAFQSVGAWIARGLSKWRMAEKEAVRLKIESSLNSAQEQINREAEGLVPYPAKVEWIENLEKAPFLDTLNEQVVVRMREHEENPRNVAYAMIDYISKGMIPYSRLYVDSPMMKAVDLTMIKKMLKTRDQSALDYFLTDVVAIEIKDEGVQHFVNLMDDLEKHGVFTRILLEELKELGLELYPIQDQVAKSETAEYVKNLHIIATKKHGEKSGGPYIGRRIKVGYVRIADAEKLYEQGSIPYISWALKCSIDGAQTIYILSREFNNKAAGWLATRIANKCKMEIVSSSQYPEIVEGRIRKAQCIKLRREKLDLVKETEQLDLDAQSSLD